jgi:hypothetical protein
MPNNLYRDTEDHTMRRGVRGEGMDTRKLWPCGHMAHGGKAKKIPGLPPVLIRCAACQVLHLSKRAI